MKVNRNQVSLIALTFLAIGAVLPLESSEGSELPESFWSSQGPYSADGYARYNPDPSVAKNFEYYDQQGNYHPRELPDANSPAYEQYRRPSWLR